MKVGQIIAKKRAVEPLESRECILEIKGIRARHDDTVFILQQVSCFVVN
jgi:hypothetical protein